MKFFIFHFSFSIFHYPLPSAIIIPPHCGLDQPVGRKSIGGGVNPRVGYTPIYKPHGGDRSQAGRYPA